MDKFKIGNKVKTPDGIGKVYSVDIANKKIILEMDYSYLVEYDLDDMMVYIKEYFEN